MNWYNRLYFSVRSWPPLHRLSLAALGLVPDWPITRDVPRLGRFRFRTRRHRWFFGDDPMGGAHTGPIRQLQSLIGHGDTVYEIGANIGYYMRTIMAHTRAGRLIAFEPMRQNVELLRANVELANLADRVTVIAVALADKPGTELLQVDDVQSGSAVLDRVSGGQPAQARRDLGLGGKTEPVAVDTLDNIVARGQIPTPQVLKIDVEGAEALVLIGAAHTIATHRPRMLLSLHGTEVARQVIRWLTTNGYQVMGQTYHDDAVRVLIPCDAATLKDNNVVALPAGDAAAG